MKPDHLIEQFISRAKKEIDNIQVLSSEEYDLLGDGETKGAILSLEETPIYRYALWRIWNDALPCLVVIMLNPSTADHSENDPTITILLGRARTEGYGGILVVNLFAWRSSEPSDMKSSNEPIGPYNDTILDIVLDIETDGLLCAWGPHGEHKDRYKEVICKLKMAQKKPLVIEMTQKGHPGHPLYKKLENRLTPWPNFESGNLSK